MNPGRRARRWDPSSPLLHTGLEKRERVRSPPSRFLEIVDALAMSTRHTNTFQALLVPGGAHPPQRSTTAKGDATRVQAAGPVPQAGPNGEVNRNLPLPSPCTCILPTQSPPVPHPLPPQHSCPPTTLPLTSACLYPLRLLSSYSLQTHSLSNARPSLLVILCGRLGALGVGLRL